MTLEAELKRPFSPSLAGGCGGGGPLGRWRGFGSGLDGRGSDPEWKEGCSSGRCCGASRGGVLGGVGVLGGEGSVSPTPPATGEGLSGGCGGGWLGAWI